MHFLPASCEKAPPVPEDDEADGWFAMPDTGKTWAQELEAWFHGIRKEQRLFQP